MKLLIDTNVILDYLSVNQGFQEYAEQVIELGVVGEAIELVSASAITDIYYVLRRALKDKELAMSRLKDLRKIISILPVTEENIDTAINRNWRDFEDAVQYSVAEANHVDYIITRNVNDFEEQKILSMEPKEFMEKVWNTLKMNNDGAGQQT